MKTYNNDKYIPINELNSIIEKETAIPSLNSILKKRESVINILKTKLSIMLNVSFDQVILEQKCLEDRRIKEIKLNEKYFKLLD